MLKLTLHPVGRRMNLQHTAAHDGVGSAPAWLGIGPRAISRQHHNNCSCSDGLTIADVTKRCAPQDGRAAWSKASRKTSADARQVLPLSPPSTPLVSLVILQPQSCSHLWFARPPDLASVIDIQSHACTAWFADPMQLLVPDGGQVAS